MDREIQLEFRKEDIAKATRIVVIAFIVLAAVIIGSKSYYTVQPSERAVVLRFGRYSSTAEPGLHFKVPFVDTVLTADVRERTIRLPFGTENYSTSVPRDVRFEDSNGVSDLMLTGNLNPVSVEWTIQWRVFDARKYMFQFHYGDHLQFSRTSQDEFLQNVVSRVGRSVMNQVIGDYSFDEVLTTKRSEIRTKAEEETQNLIDSFDCGIRITDLQLQRVVPPKEVTNSFAAVNEAAQTRVKLMNEANKERNEMMPQARADRDKAIREAEGYSDRRRAEVKGEIDALIAQYEQYKASPAETRQRLYLESMQRVLSKVEKKTIIDSDLQQMLPLFNLNQESK
ncbi:MAG: FtsH protease activity modulator HflK [Fuerstiella sp.]